jgi:transposase
MGSSRGYPSDLTDEQWAVVEPLVPAVRSGGRPEKHTRRRIVEAILYVVRTGCSWRQLPHDFAPGRRCFWYFKQWRADGTTDRIHDALRDRVRDGAGRDPMASAGIVDAQVSDRDRRVHSNTPTRNSIRPPKAPKSARACALSAAIADVRIGIATSRRSGIGGRLRRYQHRPLRAQECEGVGGVVTVRAAEEPGRLGPMRFQKMVRLPAGVSAGICMRISNRTVSYAAMAATGTQLSA